MPGPVFLSGKMVDLRLLRESDDFERCWKWINDPECRRFLGTYLPIMEPDEKDYFKQRPDDVKLAIVTKEGVHIGNIGIHKISPKHGTAETGTLIGEKKYWGMGYGTDAKMALLRWAFDELHLRKVASRVLTTNRRSIAYSKKCGYKVEGVLREEMWKNGRYVDIVQLAVLRPDFERAWKKYQAK